MCTLLNPTSVSRCRACGTRRHVRQPPPRRAPERKRGERGSRRSERGPPAEEHAASEHSVANRAPAVDEPACMGCAGKHKKHTCARRQAGGFTRQGHRARGGARGAPSAGGANRAGGGSSARPDGRLDGRRERSLGSELERLHEAAAPFGALLGGVRRHLDASGGSYGWRGDRLSRHIEALRGGLEMLGSLVSLVSEELADWRQPPQPTAPPAPPTPPTPKGKGCKAMENPTCKGVAPSKCAYTGCKKCHDETTWDCDECCDGCTRTSKGSIHYCAGPKEADPRFDDLVEFL